MIVLIFSFFSQYNGTEHASSRSISENNIKFTNKSRSSYYVKSEDDIMKLPLLKNNTNNIIIYKNDINEFKEKRKKRFWEKLISNND